MSDFSNKSEGRRRTTPQWSKDYFSKQSNISSAEKQVNRSKRYCPMCGMTFANVGNTTRHVINIHKISRDIVHTLWDSPSTPEVYEEWEDDDDEDVVLAIDCSTHAEIPLKTLVIE